MATTSSSRPAGPCTTLLARRALQISWPSAGSTSASLALVLPTSKTAISAVVGAHRRFTNAGTATTRISSEPGEDRHDDARNVHEPEPESHEAEHQRGEHHAKDAALAAPHRYAAQDHHADDLELPALRDRRARRAQARGEQHRGEPAEQPRQRKQREPVTIHGNARKAAGHRIGADGEDGPAPARAMQEHAEQYCEQREQAPARWRSGPTR